MQRLYERLTDPDTGYDNREGLRWDSWWAAICGEGVWIFIGLGGTTCSAVRLLTGKAAAALFSFEIILYLAMIFWQHVSNVKLICSLAAHYLEMTDNHTNGLTKTIDFPSGFSLFSFGVFPAAGMIVLFCFGLTDAAGAC